MSFATSRLTLADALRQVVMETLKKLGWEPPHEEEAINSSEADNLRVNMPLGMTPAGSDRPAILPREPCNGRHAGNDGGY